MPQLERIYKIVDPIPTTKSVPDSQDLTGGSLYSMHSWYQRLVQGSSTRMTRYREYDRMDDDVDVTRALDIIAEEMTNLDANTKLPLYVDMQNGDEVADENVGITLRAALRIWSNMHEFDSKLFSICRNTIKYGDCFFIKRKETGKWEHIHPNHVTTAVVDEHDVTKIRALQIRKNTKDAQETYGGITVNTNKEHETEFVPVDECVIFSLNDDMSKTAPFGESVLRSVFRSHKQKVLLEDSIIIYRVSRAPERRVFYIDVGKMPPNRVKQYLESIKNEIKQKKIPTQNRNGEAQIESVYNPHSMQEDFYFAQRADGKGSRVETLPGGQGLGELTDLEYFQEKVWEGMRVPSSYMRSRNGENPIFNDGRAGQSYVEELRFMFFVKRLQRRVERALDREFKLFLKSQNINIDPTSYKIRLPEGENFYKYREQEVQAALLGNITTADGIPYLSKRWIMAHIGQMREDEILSNEKWLREERGIVENDPEIMQKLYGTPGEGDAGGGGGLGGPIGGPGGGLDMVAEPGDDFGEDTPDLSADAPAQDSVNIPDNPQSNS
jgi:hypothetical protein